MVGSVGFVEIGLRISKALDRFSREHGLVVQEIGIFLRSNVFRWQWPDKRDNG